MRGSYYDVLGVSATASQEKIKAHYLRLIQRYHPDRSRSPLAHARAAEINEAFHYLSDPELRAQHDAGLAARRRDVVNVRALDRSRSGSRALVVHRRRRRPLFRRYDAWLTLIAVLSLAGIGSWQIEQRLLGGDASPAALASDDDTDGAAERAVQLLAAATAREAQAMPSVSGAIVARGVGAYHRYAADGDFGRARAYSEQCHAQAANADGWDAVDFCVAFDQAAFAAIAKSPGGLSGDAGYFVDRHDRAAHLYVTRISSLDAIDRRLGQIQRQVATLRAAQGDAPPKGVLHRISKRGGRFADALREFLAASDTKQDRAGHRQAGDF
ncbi:DnaJ domain-containing protein [Sphingomonas abietis]|uniref:DnaJ domain-containing protein n=1 Tax=Sphingomonas abietis TaxID=3012344 RepID=A0ABY7NJZ1_9SPHN|nr:DnaJ domain-containing protein [Sphingomonas abietis]WBO20836.1 DnaJ domain-containing protein [Sphingomonas abietis]